MPAPDEFRKGDVRIRRYDHHPKQAARRELLQRGSPLGLPDDKEVLRGRRFFLVQRIVDFEQFADMTLRL